MQERARRGHNTHFIAIVESKTNEDATGYQETAVRLQKEWNFEDPQALTFAPRVPDQALVKLLNKGLIFGSLERDFARVRRFLWNGLRV